MRVSGLHTSDLPPRSVDPARGRLLVGTFASCAAMAVLSGCLLALRFDEGAAPKSRLLWTSIALSVLFGLSVLLIALLMLQWLAAAATNPDSREPSGARAGCCRRSPP